METSTINQIIESGTFLIISLAALGYYSMGIRFRKRISTEIKLLQDCYYYRSVIEKYKVDRKNGGESSGYIKVRKQVESDLGYSASTHSEPRNIKTRLEVLAKHDSDIKEFVDKIHI